jgi:hypothetical protein
MPECLAGQTLDQIAQYCTLGKPLGNHQTETSPAIRTRFTTLIAAITQLKAAVALPQRAGHDYSELVRPMQTVQQTKAVTAAGSPGHGRAILPDGRLNAETLAALGAPGTNDGTTAAGTHAHQETMGALAAHNRWLISPFHGLAL